jgi:TolB-like protein/Tfp pilus assembly protein PilF
VIIVYAAVAFVILQLAEILAPSLRLPDWTINFILVVLIVGFIIAIILSWIYDIHPEEGIVKTEPAHKVKDEDQHLSSNGWKIASYISFVVIVTLIVLNIIPRTSRSDIEEVLDKSIAVLPLEYLSANPDNEYLANGVLDAITGHLSLIKGLRVMPRTSVEQYREYKKTAKEIGEELDVSYLVEGSFQMVDNQVKLIIQLVHAEEGDHIFFKEYDRNYSDIFAVQSEVSQTIAKEIEVAITPEEKQRIEKRSTANLTAYDFYLKGNEEYENYWFYSKDPEALERSEDLYYKALEYDSTFAQAYCGLAAVYLDKHGWDTYFPESVLDSALNLANIALSFDDQLADAYLFRGQYYNMRNNIEKAINEYDKAIKINPNLSAAYRALGKLYSLDDFVRAIDNFHKAASVNRGPLFPYLLREISGVYAQAGFIEKAVSYTTEALKLDGDTAKYYYQLSNYEYYNGNYEKAIEIWKKSYAIDSTNRYVNFRLGMTYLFLGQFDKYLIYLNKFKNSIETSNIFYPMCMIRIGHAYWVNGYKEEGKYYLEKGLEFHNEMVEMDRHLFGDFVTFYNLASVHAFLGDRDKAFENLRQLNQWEIMPQRMVAYFKDDPMLDSIRDEPEFQQILRDVEAKYQAEHERVRKWLEENDML